uniref:Uncharacterized protein n=1 Tax=Hyaloperonospora arabidopsidis (strain Emoy2) TaxID=559515 RepID=M4BCV2_HYAAE
MCNHVISPLAQWLVNHVLSTRLAPNAITIGALYAPNMEEEAPRGLVFDHGCDALNVIISACTFASTIKLEATYWSLLLFLAPPMVFFMATWEEYYTGTLALPVIDGPTRAC